MTTIQQVLFELETDYMGHPYYLTGHALYTALARRVDAQARRSLNVSTGVFVPGEYGAYPESHSHDGYGGKLGMSLPPVESYEDVFVCRDAAQRWLLDSRPRDAHNTHDVQSHGGRLAFAPKAHFGRPPEHRNSKRTMHWHVHCYLHADGETRTSSRFPWMYWMGCVSAGVETTGSVNYRSRRRRSLIWMTSITRGFEKQTTSSWNCCRRTCCRAIRRG